MRNVEAEEQRTKLKNNLLNKEKENNENGPETSRFGSKLKDSAKKPYVMTIDLMDMEKSDIDSNNYNDDFQKPCNKLQKARQKYRDKPELVPVQPQDTPSQFVKKKDWNSNKRFGIQNNSSHVPTNKPPKPNTTPKRHASYNESKSPRPKNTSISRFHPGPPYLDEHDLDIKSHKTDIRPIQEDIDNRFDHIHYHRHSKSINQDYIDDYPDNVTIDLTKCASSFGYNSVSKDSSETIDLVPSATRIFEAKHHNTDLDVINMVNFCENHDSAKSGYAGLASYTQDEYMKFAKRKKHVIVDVDPCKDMDIRDLPIRDRVKLIKDKLNVSNFSNKVQMVNEKEKARF